MSPQTPGLHHVTATVGDPQRNADFYVGTPRTTITFFPWGEAGRRGELGAGQTRTTAYLVPEDSADYWVDRLESEGVEYERERIEARLPEFDGPPVGGD